MSHWRILTGDVRERLADLADGSVRCCVTSPPYWGLRDYGHSGQIGLEQTPELYTAEMVRLFREVRRVLSDDGTLWLNLGDSYAGGGTIGRNNTGPDDLARRAARFGTGVGSGSAVGFHGIRPAAPNLKPKDLVGIPWVVAFALRADGWYLRSDIIWHKPNPMPESVTDRPTKAHEYIFLLSKSQRYYYDADAIREPHSEASLGRYEYGLNVKANPNAIKGSLQDRLQSGLGKSERLGDFIDPAGRNKRSVWTVTTQPYQEAHFATFPEALIEPCILAGSQLSGKRCDCDDVIETPLGTGPSNDPTSLTGRAGMNRPRRTDEGTRPITRREQRDYAGQLRQSRFRERMAAEAGSAFDHYIRIDDAGARPIPPNLLCRWRDAGWLIDPLPCSHETYDADTVLDPFCGSGTTGAVAIRHQRNFVGIELNPQYVELARKRIGNVAPLLAQEIA